MTAFPTLQTDRLELRPYGLDDFVDCAALWADPATVAFIGNGQPLGPEDTWSRLLRAIGHWQALGFGYWAVRDRGTGRFVGEVGFQSLRRIMEPAFSDAPEIGWVLASSAQGQGLGREAVAAALRWADTVLPATETVCIIRPDHGRSIRLAEEAGYRPRADALYRGATVRQFSRPKLPPTAHISRSGVHEIHDR